jgi:hypothetical protein
MKYLCLIYLSEANWAACPDSTCNEYAESVQRSGRLIAGEALHPVGTATTVRRRNGQVMVTDGPFAETKEHLAGFYLIEARDLNEALQVAAHIPPAQYGSVEVRPVRELDVSAAHSV